MIYLDNAASTPVHPDVIKEMLPFLINHYGNPSSLHHFGRVTSNAILKSRNRVSKLVGAATDEIYFTSGGTESNNLAIIGYANFLRKTNPSINRILISQIEHDSILETVKFLEKEFNFIIEYIPVTNNGIIDLKKFSNMITNSTGLISIMLVNNEIGTIQPLKECIQIAKNKNDKVIFHTDAVQALGKIPVNVKNLNVDMLSISSHKINGPKGVGAIYIKKTLKPLPLIYGGNQEKGLRSGTENVAGIIGFGKACKLWETILEDQSQKIKTLQTQMASRINSEIPYSKLNGSMTERVSNNLNYSFLGVNGEDLLIKLDEKGLELSTGSACSTNKKQKASHVLKALGLKYEEINSSIRISLGYQNTIEEIENACDILAQTIKDLRYENSVINK